MRAKHRKSRTLRLFVLALLLASGWVYNTVGLLPGRLKSDLEDRLAGWTGYQIRFDRAYLEPFTGVRFAKVEVISPKGPRLLTAEEVIFRPDWWELLVSRRILIEDVIIRQAVTRYFRHPEGLSGPAENPAKDLLSFLSSLAKPASAEASAEKIRFRNLHLIDASLFVQNPEKSSRPITALSEIHLLARLDLEPKIPFTLSFLLGHEIQVYRANGFFDTADKHYEILAVGTLERLPSFIADLPALHHWRIQSASGDFRVRVSGDAAGAYFDCVNGEMRIRVERPDSSAEFRLSSQSTFHADWENRSFSLQSARLRFQDGVFESLLLDPDPVTRIRGNISWENDRAFTEDLTFKRGRSAYRLRGNLMTHAPFEAELEAQERSTRLTQWEKRLPAWLKNDLGLASLRAHMNASFLFTGPMSDPVKALQKAQIQIRDGVLKPGFLPRRLHHLNGQVIAEASRIELKSFKGEVGLKPFELDLTWPLHRKGPCDLNLRFPDPTDVSGQPPLALTAKLELEEEKIRIESLWLASGLSRLSFKGEVESLQTLHADLTLSGTVDAADWTRRWGNRMAFLPPFRPKGILDFQGTLLGPLGNPQELSARLTLRGQSVGLWDLLQIQSVESDWIYSRGLLELGYSKSDLYGGDLRVTGKIDLRKLPGQKTPLYPFELKAFTQDTDVSKLLNKMSFLDKKVSGTLAADADLSGFLGDTRTVKGVGHFRIHGGYLWATPLFKELKNLSFLTIEGIENLLFSEAEGSFSLSEGFLHSEDSILKSHLIDVHVRGKMGLDRSLDLFVISRFSPGLIEETRQIGGLAPAIIRVAEAKITEYRLLGFLESPLFTPLTPPTT